MSFLTLDICNAALVRIGEKPIASLTDDSPAARIVNLRYRQVFDFVLTLHPFTCATTRRILLPDPSKTKVLHYSYFYRLPDDCLRFLEVFSQQEEYLHDYEVEEGGIWCNESSWIVLRYLRRITDESLIDFDVGQLMALYLAYDIGERLNSNPDRQKMIYQEFREMFSRVRTNDARKQPPKFYGTSDPFGTHIPELPSSWNDARA